MNITEEILEQYKDARKKVIKARFDFLLDNA